MRKDKNKGFTLAELLIIVAVIAILVSVVAANLFKYIEKTQVTDDIASAQVIQAAVQATLNDALLNKQVQKSSLAGAGDTSYFIGSPGTEFVIDPALNALDGVTGAVVLSDVNENLGTLPEFKLKKPMKSGHGAPAKWRVFCDYSDKNNPKVSVYVQDSSTNDVKVLPDPDPDSLYYKYAK